MSTTIASLWHYPVKGLSPQSLTQVTLTPGQGLPQDRRFAILHGQSRFDRTAPSWMPKENFLMLKRDAWLARLQTHFDAESNVLRICDGDPTQNTTVIAGRLDDATERARLETFLADLAPDAISGRPEIIEVPPHMFSDSPEKFVSVLNAASITELGMGLETEVDPRRFRGNILLDGLRPWEERNWLGHTLTIGAAGVQLKVVREIVRCPATSVNPRTAERDLNIPKALQARYGHAFCGVYAHVVQGGNIGLGDAVSLVA